jgi:hypothetical protein
MDSTGIKAEGEGEWKSRKHGGSKQRIWRKIQIGIDEETLEVRAVKVTTSNVGDAPFLPELLLRRSHPIRTSAASQPTVPTIPENATTRSLPVMPTPSSRRARTPSRGNPSTSASTRSNGAQWYRTRSESLEGALFD